MTWRWVEIRTFNHPDDERMRIAQRVTVESRSRNFRSNVTVGSFGLD